jgi:MFS transporter, DHA2 family, multidrug resistance protein
MTEKITSTAPKAIVITAAKAGRREWLGLSILILPTLLIAIDMTVTYLSIPAISAALRPTSAELLWITDIFGFVEAGLLIVMGNLGDRIGVKKLLLTGGAAFAIASTIAAFSGSAVTLIIARAMLGMAGSTILTSVLSLIRNMFHNDVERTFAMGLYTTTFSLGTMLGPVVGGLLLTYFWWGAVFLVAVPIIAILLIAGPVLLPEFKDSKAGNLDLTSAGLLIAASLCTIYGIKQTAQNGAGWVSSLFIVAGIVTGITFYRRQKGLSHPLIDLSLFRKAKFNAALAALFVALFSWAGISIFTGQYLQLIAGLDPLTAGLWTIPGAASSILTCMLAPFAVKRIQRGHLMTAGLLILAVGMGLIGLVTIHSFALLIVAIILISAGCGVTVTLGIDMVIAGAAPERAGAAAGVAQTSTTFGGSMGIALLGSVWTVLYRSKLSTVIAGNISQQDKGAAQSTLGGAIAVAKKLHDRAGDLLMHDAREAFVHSLNGTAAVCSGVIILVAVVAAVNFRKTAG